MQPGGYFVGGRADVPAEAVGPQQPSRRGVGGGRIGGQRGWSPNCQGHDDREHRRKEGGQEQGAEKHSLSARDFTEIAGFQFHPQRDHQAEGHAENADIQDHLHCESLVRRLAG
jgi:hypothetical protein